MSLKHFGKAFAAAVSSFNQHFNHNNRDTYPNNINQKMAWNNRPSVSMRGVAKYEVLKNAKVVKNIGHFPDLSVAFTEMFTHDVGPINISIEDISGVGSASFKNTHDDLECVNLNQFVEQDCMYYAAEKTLENLQNLIQQIKKGLNKDINFTIYGWSHQLFQSAGNVSHRTCAAVYLARQLNFQASLSSTVEFIKIDQRVLKAFDDVYQSYIVPFYESELMEQYLNQHKIPFLQLGYPQYFPCNSYIYVIFKKDLPNDFHIDTKLNRLNQYFTDFNKVLIGQLEIQKQNPLLSKYTFIKDI